MYPSVSKFLKDCDIPFTEENLKKIRLKQLIVKTNLEFDSSEKDTFIAEGKDRFLTDCCIAALRKIHSQYNHQSNPLISPETLKSFWLSCSIPIAFTGAFWFIALILAFNESGNSSYLIGAVVSLLALLSSIMLWIYDCWFDKKN